MFRKQSAEHVSREEYNRSHAILDSVLKDDRTVKVLGKDCIDAVKDLQLVLRSKEDYLAYWPRRGIMMSFRAKTTSPVESMNEVTKHGPKGIHSNMNLSKSLPMVAEGVDDRLQDFNNSAMRELGMTNRASRAPTKDNILVTDPSI